MQRMRQLLRPAILALASVVAVIGVPSPASAHTDIDYTLPTDGEQATLPISEITVAFNDAVTLVGAGFEVLTPAGAVVQPSVFSEDGAVYFLEVAEPLAGGVAAVRYQVAAADGHVLEGGFSFTVPAAPVATTAPPTVAPAPSAPATSGLVPTPTPGPTTAPSVIVAAPSTSGASAVLATTADDDGGGMGIVVPIIVVIVVGGAALFLIRSRSSRPT